VSSSFFALASSCFLYRSLLRGVVGRLLAAACRLLACDLVVTPPACLPDTDCAAWLIFSLLQFAKKTERRILLQEILETSQ
jgi:hypothetical protein